VQHGAGRRVLVPLSYNPKELAYFVAPNTRSNTAGPPSNYAMSGPSFAPERNEVWYTDGNSGFYNVRLTGGRRNGRRRGAHRTRGPGSGRVHR
jgi:hypothetical protein